MTLKPFYFIFGMIFLVACNSNPTQGAADYAMAVKYMRGSGVAKDEQKALTYLVRAADAGNPQAELAMGYYFLKGTGGIKQDSAKAAAFFTKAAEQGNRDAQYNVGLAYVRGEGVAKDLTKAYRWFEQAALQDDTGAQYNVGVMAMNGEGRTADSLTAYVWFKLASEKAYGGAVEAMDTANTGMTADQAKEIDREYAKVLRKIKKPVESNPGNQPL